MTRFYATVLLLATALTTCAQHFPQQLHELAHTADSTVNELLRSVAPKLEGDALTALVARLEGVAADPAYSDYQRAAALSIAGNLHFQRQQPDSAFIAYRRALPLAADFPTDDIIYAIVHGNYGMYMEHFEVYEEATPHLVKSLRTVQQQPNRRLGLEARLYRAIIRANLGAGQLSVAQHFQREMIATLQAAGDRPGVVRAHNDVGLYHAQLGKSAAALHHFRLALDQLDTLRQDEHLLYVNVLESRAHTLIAEGDFLAGIDDLEYVFAVRKRYGNYRHAMQSLAYLIDYHLDCEQPRWALQYFTKHRAFFRSQSSINPRTVPLYRAMARLYETLDDPAAAAPFRHVYNQFTVDKLHRDGTLANERTHLNAYVAARHLAYERELQLEQSERQRLAENLQKNRLLTLLFGLLLGAMALLAFVHLLWRRRDAEQARALERQTSEALRLQNENLEYELELRQRDLTRLAADNKLRTRLKRQFQRQLRRLIRYEGTDLKWELNRLAESMDRAVEEQEHRSVVQDNVQEINAGFEERLRDRIPDISGQEIRLCELIRVGMGNANIARTLDRKEATVRSYKFRLKKKAGVETSEELEGMVRGL